MAEQEGRTRNTTRPGAHDVVTVLLNGMRTPLILTIADLTRDLASKLGYSSEAGIIISDVRPAAAGAAAGLRPGMLIREVNRTRVSTAGEFKMALDHRSGTRPVLLLVTDGVYTQYTALRQED